MSVLLEKQIGVKNREESDNNKVRSSVICNAPEKL